MQKTRTTDREITMIPSRRRAARPDWAIMHFEGIAHLVHLRVMRRGLLDRKVAGEIRTKEELADRTGCSRSTVSRFFAGRSASIDVVIRLTRELKLKFEDVCRPVDEELLDRLMREGAVIQRGDAVLLTTNPARLLAAHVPGAPIPRPGSKEEMCR